MIISNDFKEERLEITVNAVEVRDPRIRIFIGEFPFFSNVTRFS